MVIILPSTPDGICIISTYDGVCQRINWNFVDGISGYNVYRAPVPYGHFERLNTSLINGLTYWDTPPVTLHNDFWYEVSAENVDAEGALSDPYSVWEQWVFGVTPSFPGLSLTNLL